MAGILGPRAGLDGCGKSLPSRIRSLDRPARSESLPNTQPRSAQRLYTMKNMCMYIHISYCVQIVYELLLQPNNTASETFLHKSGAVRSVDWIFIIVSPAWR